MYHPLWPDLKVPQHILELAANPSLACVENLGSGAYNTAFGYGDWVVKVGMNKGHDCGTDWQDLMDYVMTLSQDWINLFSMILVPTVVVSRHVVIQKRVRKMGYMLEDFSLARGVENLAEALGMYDVHEYNWGLSDRDEIQIFDPMPTYSYPVVQAGDAECYVTDPDTNTQKYLAPIASLAMRITASEHLFV